MSEVESLINIPVEHCSNIFGQKAAGIAVYKTKEIWKDTEYGYAPGVF